MTLRDLVMFAIGAALVRLFHLVRWWITCYRYDHRPTPPRTEIERAKALEAMYDGYHYEKPKVDNNYIIGVDPSE